MTTEINKLQRYEGYLSSDPDNLQLRVDTIELALSVGQLARAQELAEQGLLLMPENFFLRARLGYVLLVRHEWVAASALFADLLARQPDKIVAHNLAFSLMQQGLYQQVLDCLLPWVQGEQIFPPSVATFIRALHHLNQVDVAIPFIEQHAKLCENEADFLATASLIFLDANNLQEAQRYAEMATARGATSSEPLLVFGAMALAEMDSQRAMASYETILRQNPVEGRAWMGLGLTQTLDRNFDAAVSSLETALKYIPKQLGTWQLLGWCKIFQNDLPGAHAVFEQALELDRNFGEAQGGMATILALQGRADEAQAKIDRAMRLDPQCLSARYAQLVLTGKNRNSDEFRDMALKILATRAAPLGGNLAEMLITLEHKK